MQNRGQLCKRAFREMAQLPRYRQQGSRALFDGALALADIGRRLIMEPDTMEKALEGT